MAVPSNLIVPLKLDAFVLNAKVCSGEPKDAKIAPITQPNYTFLRIKDFVAQNDVLNHVDLHRTTPADLNSRFSDIGSLPVNREGEPRHPPRADRVGVYLHWMMPRAYRSGVATSPPPSGEGAGSATGGGESKVDNTAPVFRTVPNRWLVIRKLHPGFLPENKIIPDVEAWVVESDRLRNIGDTEDLGREIDLQVDVSPYVDGSGTIDAQAEVFIGWKGPAVGWAEQKKPRVPLTVLSSSNPLFPDYQPHNSNVFSIVDNFKYELNDVKLYLTKATASYFVVGWHSDPCNDLMAIPTPPPEIPSTLESRLSACMMEFDETVLASADVKAWLESTASGQLLCHGAMYNVQWNADEKPTNLPADTISHHINDKLPVAIGTTPLDSLLAFIQAHKGTETDDDIKKLENDLIAIQALLIAQNDDGVDAQRQATDMLNNQNYDRIEGGIHYHISGSDETQNPGKPADVEIKALAKLNRLRFAFDTHQRTIRRKRWDLFALWWTYITTLANLGGGNDTAVRAKVDALTKQIHGDDGHGGLIASLKQLEQEAVQEKAKIAKAEPGVLPSLYQQRDPTLLVGGIEAGWPFDFLDKLKVRLQKHIISEKPTQQITPDSDKMLKDVVKNLPLGVQGSANALVNEFLYLEPVDGKRVEEAPKDRLLPLYNERDKSVEVRWRNTWNGQPWFPLFLEWEVEYTHIPFLEWTLDEQTSRQSVSPMLRYGIPGKTDLTKFKDTRLISGRVLVLPQPNFSLKSRIEQLFDNTHAEILNQYLSEEDRENLTTNLFKLSFVSAPLAGLTDHLLTRVQGSHIKPNTRPPNEKPQPIDHVIKVGEGAGFDKVRLELIDQESDLTPYGSLVEVVAETCAFKPVTHGQMRFTKLNIIDKFGQAIHAIDPRIAERPPPMYPCVSELYACQSKEGQPGVANTVGDRPDAPGLCEFVQLPPQINQYARLNSVFVVKGTRSGEEEGIKKYWNPMSEWENPVWGWVVINYADHGVQFFLPDGTFYKAVRSGGRGGATTSPAWLPFGKPTHPAAGQTPKQLDRLIKKLESPIYLQAFVDMINEASRNGPAAPSAYAQFLGSVVGKPLALANMGWSLELAVGVLENQSKLGKPDPLEPLTEYNFPVKFGDKDRVYDGLVGYFDLASKEDVDPEDPDGDLDLRRIYTYSKQPPSDGSPLRIISQENHPRFTPFWINPSDPNNPEGTDVADNITAERTKELKVFGVLIDPFTPLHGYSSFLPIQPLALPPWTWHTALSKMTAFFHMGPIMVTEGIPLYNKEYKLESNYTEETKAPVGAVPIPALGLADWNWLQPYIDSTDTDALDGRVFMALGLGKLDNRPRFEKSPYSAIEGYLQLKRPLEPEKSEEVTPEPKPDPKPEPEPEEPEEARPRLEEVD